MNRILIKKGKGIVKTCSSDRSSSLIQNDISSRFAQNVPLSSASAIDKIIASRKHEIYGSIATTSHSYGARRPQDIDLAVQNPRETACEILSIIRKKGIKSEIYESKSPNAYSVKILKDGEMKTGIDLHPIKHHYKNYKVVYGSTLPAERIGKFQVQSIRDQQLRKGASVLKKEGADEHRILKDEADFINVSRLMLDQKQLMAESELARIKKSRKDLEAIKKHTRKHKEYNSREYPISKDTIPEKQKQKFIKFSLQHPSTDVRNLILQNNKVKTITQKKKNKRVEMLDPQNDIWNYWKQ